MIKFAKKLLKTSNLIRISARQINTSNSSNTTQSQFSEKEGDLGFQPPLEDFEFDGNAFAVNAINFAKQKVKPKEVLQKENEYQLKLIRERIKFQGDPFELVEKDVNAVKDFAINNVIKTEYKQLELPAIYNMSLKGKNFRSAIMCMLARAIFNNNPQYQNVSSQFEQTKYYTQVKTLSACIELAHNASLLQGELIQAKRDMMKKGQVNTDKFDVDDYFGSYVSKTYYKTASMISLGCRGLGIIFDLDTEAQRKLFNFGANLGIAFQVHDDILDFTQNSEQLGKPAYNDIKEVKFFQQIFYQGIITAPLVYTFVEMQQQQSPNVYDFEQRLKRKFQEPGDVQFAIDHLFKSSGIEMADKLSIDYINESLLNLDSLLVEDTSQGQKHSIISIDKDVYAQALLGVALKVKTRKY
ncbi:solanesyl diphosphate synthase [Stylonychia lemnae]|uniref:Solanesyl diphosphate synthase n=1 Tax=Stylonychia lemnae TaxID=5949 RepID=A0A077ZZ62_STYLE|nr:solanesyl diphosphate synthase [Stylonychia lemnae]|eukprot:CDW74503.1 solanesyl diphosphate synthase [Stylonychia lemnae]